MKKLTVIIPFFNEEKTIGKLLKKLLSTKLPVKQLEYILVDDGSTDASVSVVQELQKNHKKLILVKHKKNLGKGAAIISGLKHAKGDYIIIQDADLEYNPEDIAKLILAASNEFPVVYGTRLKRLPNFTRDERTPLFITHYFGNKFLSLFTSILYHHWITDMENCYKLFPRDVMVNIKLNARGFDFEPEITAKLLKSGYKITEVPITTYPRGYKEGKKIHTLKDGTKALWTLLKYRFID